MRFVSSILLVCALSASFAQANSDSFKAAKFAELQEKIGRDLTNEEIKVLSQIIDANDLAEPEATFQTVAGGDSKSMNTIWCVGAKAGVAAIGGGGGLCLDTSGASHIVTFAGLGLIQGLAGEAFVLFVQTSSTVKGYYIGLGGGNSLDVISKAAGILNVAPTVFGADVKAFGEVNPMFGRRAYSFETNYNLWPIKTNGNTAVLVGVTLGKVVDVTSMGMVID